MSEPSAATRGGGRTLTVILAACLLAAIALRTYNHAAFDLTSSHDAPTHRHFVMQAYALMMPDYYCGPYYYYWTAGHAVAARTFNLSSNAYDTPEMNFVATGTVAGNFHLFLWYLAGVFALGGALGLRGRERLAWLALASCLPIVHRSMNMLRPENLMLAILPWCLVLLLHWWNRARQTGGSIRDRRVWAMVVPAVVFGTQKIGGVGVLVGCAAGLLLAPAGRTQRGLRAMAVAGVVFVVLAGSVTLIHHETTAHKRWLFKHFAYNNPVFSMYHHSAPLTFYVRFDPASVWRDPFRDAHKDSMFNILSADLFGDYWRYGIDYKILDQESAWRLARIRFGLVACAVFVVLWLAGAAWLTRRTVAGDEGVAHQSVVAFAVLFLSLAYVASAARVFYQPDKGDIIKWEYMVWVAPALVLPVVAAGRWSGRAGAVARLATVLVTVAGLLQSIQPR